jgi:hypothetical protein
MKSRFQPEPTHHRVDLILFRLAHDGVVQAKPDIGRLVGRKLSESCDR